MVVILASACGMMRDDSATAASKKNDWFEYAYYSSPVNFESADDVAARHARPLRLQ